MYCPRCNAPLSKSANDCFNCGLALTYPGMEPTSPYPPRPQYSQYSQYPASQSQSQPLVSGQAPSQPPHPVMSDPITLNSATYVGAQATPAQAPTQVNEWRLLGSIRVVAVLAGMAVCDLAITFLVVVNLSRKDWGDGAVAAAIVAFGVAAIALLVAILRAVTGQWKSVGFALNVMMVVALLLLGTGGIVFKMPVWMLQAHHYEDDGAWSAALAQYALMARDPACGQDCQRTVTGAMAHAHYGYGYQLEFQHNYEAAIDQFQSSLSASPSGLDAVMAHVELAHTYYSYGLELTAQGNYRSALVMFTASQETSPNGPYAHQSYLDAATADYSLAKQQIANGQTCAMGAGRLQELVQKYADSPEAQRAKAELAVRVRVSGAIYGYLTNSSQPFQVWLSSKASAPPYGAYLPPGSYSFSADYRTILDPKTSEFVFPHVLPGTYTVSTYRSNYTWWYAEDKIHLYFMQVGPICSFTWTPLPCTYGCP